MLRGLHRLGLAPEDAVFDALFATLDNNPADGKVNFKKFKVALDHHKKTPAFRARASDSQFQAFLASAVARMMALDSAARNGIHKSNGAESNGTQESPDSGSLE